MKKRWLVILVMAIFLILTLVLWPKNNRVCFPNVCVDIELAQTADEKAKGLMFRTHLPEGQGMLFVYEEEGIYPFWMKNTLIPLDMIWISGDFKVVDVRHAIPCPSDSCASYTPSAKAKYILEVNSGFTEKYYIKVGDSLIIN